MELLDSQAIRRVLPEGTLTYVHSDVVRTIERLFRDSIELDYLHPPPLGGSSCWIWQAMVARCVEKHLLRRHSKFCTAFRNSHAGSLEIIQLFLENFISHGDAAQPRNHPIVSRTLHFAWRCCMKLILTRSCIDNPHHCRALGAYLPRSLEVL